MRAGSWNIVRCVEGTSTASMFNEKLQAALSFLADIVALRAIDVFSKHSLLIPARSKIHQEVRGAFRSSRIKVFGRPQSIRMDESGRWGNLRWELRWGIRCGNEVWE